MAPKTTPHRPRHTDLTPGTPAGVDGPTIRKLADLDKDGKISPQEAKNFPLMESNFKDIDQDKDGFISDTELQQALDYYRKKL